MKRREYDKNTIKDAVQRYEKIQDEMTYSSAILDFMQTYNLNHEDAKNLLDVAFNS